MPVGLASSSMLVLWLWSRTSIASDVESNGKGDVNINGSVDGDVVSGLNCKPKCNNVVNVPCPPAPAPKDPCEDGKARGVCQWDGSQPFCDGACTGTSVQCGSKSCRGTGSKQLCCPPVQDIAYTCNVNIQMSCGCGNNRHKMNCQQYKSKNCTGIENLDYCNALLDQFEKAGGDQCTANSSSRCTVNRFSLLFCFSLLLWNVFGDIDVGGNVEGNVVDGINCKIEVTEVESSSGGSNNTKHTAIYGCGNTYYQINCEMASNDQCSISTHTSAVAKGGEASGGKSKVGLGLNADFSEQTTSSDPGCNNAIELFKEDNKECGNLNSGSLDPSASLVTTIALCSVSLHRIH